MRGTLTALLLCAVLAGCGPGGGPDAATDAYCPLAVEVGPSGGATFRAYEDGDDAQIVLGFQGFQMLVLDVRFRGSMSASADLQGSIELADRPIAASRIERAVPTVAEGDATRAEGFLLFFNDAPLSELQGREADLTIIARSGGCVGGTRVRVRLSDEPPCIDPATTIPDVAARDAGALPDGSVRCGAP